MYFDLSVCWDPKRAPSLVDLALRFGYAGVAHNVTVSEGQILDLPRHRCPINACKLPASASTRSGPLRPRGMDMGVGGCEGGGGFLQLRRLTAVVADQGQVGAVSQAAPKLRQAYELIAMRPVSEEAWLCAAEQGDCDILSLALDERMLFPLKRPPVLAFLKRGGIFEVEFAPALRDVSSRRALFSNVEQLLHATRGHGVMLSSAARDAIEMRSPHDLANFAAVLGLRGALAAKSLADVPYQALQHGALRRGCAQTIQSASKPPVDKDHEMGGEEFLAL
eukprot:gnl/TRDRNA2_/TRDRNA2_42340_c0_seq1.p1 gnl/TRDRNA2_/TRDRNA2_42340_c0~~gnl/TRDRNA2_/TRDRNA2_42340_c0_seq1.p1  ORF type:complete len:279 (+),score=45.99 gnl/TRDRNA2_/TRDRNA2_42340_c0_seq1:122-958(+)